MRQLLILPALVAAACGGWSKKDTALELGMIPAVAADWTQTQAITERCSEGNPVIGECGQNVSLGWYFPATLIAHGLISAALPAGWWRTAWQALTLGIEVKTVHSNALHGVEFWP